MKLSIMIWSNGFKYSLGKYIPEVRQNVSLRVYIYPILESIFHNDSTKFHILIVFVSRYINELVYY
jgi:hypothetical protein